MILQLRKELAEAMRAGEGELLRFELGPIELELTVAVEGEAESGGNVRFWVVELGGKYRRRRGATQRIKLTLDPKADGRTPLISDDEQPGER